MCGGERATCGMSHSQLSSEEDSWACETVNTPPPFRRSHLLDWPSSRNLVRNSKKRFLWYSSQREKEVIYGFIDMVSVFSQLWGISSEVSKRVLHKSCFEDDVSES